MDLFRLEVGKAVAEGFPVGGQAPVGFVVRAGSTARVRKTGADRNGKLPGRLKDLERVGVLARHARDPELRVFVKDHHFDSPTAAGDIVNGANLSAPEKWRHAQTGQSLKDWLAAGP